MVLDKESAKQQISKLVEKYQRLLESGQLKDYSETRTRREFIEQLFGFLGWDMFNAENENEVISEESIENGRPDLTFKLNGRTVMILEAKSFKADLDDLQWAEQAVSYAWNQGVSWAILTDFEATKIFYAEISPKDIAKNPPIEISYQSYVKDFDFLYNLLSKESIQRGSLDKWAEKIGKAFKRKPVGDKLFEDLTQWRSLLSKAILKNNHVAQEEVDNGVQKILDRLIFIRTAEDRKLENTNPLRGLLNSYESGDKRDLYSTLVKLFKDFDSGYDSTLFADDYSEKWKIDDGALLEVLNGLYQTRDGYRYDFAAISVDVLGYIYQHYLGYVLQKKGGVVTEKSGKRKKQGIFYTPKYIADFIVKNTLGEILKTTKPKDIAKLKVLDPACGSGSFLTAAYEEFQKYYLKHEKQASLLTNLDILKKNLYGVDLDSQAVEIAQLNLLLKVLFQKGKLPDLKHNIRNGNSLVSGDEEKLKRYFGEKRQEQKPFSWQEEFKEVFDSNGFDVVIGNPPYVNLANIEDKNFREYLKKEFKTAKNKSDLYSFFIERALGLLRDGGLLGFIVSNSWLGTDSFSKFREFLIQNTTVVKLVKLRLGVFKDAVVTPVLIFVKKEVPKPNHEIELMEFVNGEFLKLPHKLSYKRIIASPSFNFSFNPELGFEIPTIKLGEIAKFSLGIKTSDDGRFISDGKKDVDSHPLLRGKDVDRYSHKYANKWIWYKPDLMMEKTGAGPRNLEYFQSEKILIKDIAQSISATYDKEGYLTSDTLSLIYKADNYDLRFILALLNSKLVNKWFKTTFPAGLHIKINQLKEIPIPKFDFSSPGGKKLHDILVSMAQKILDLHEELQTAIEGANKFNTIRSEIEKLDYQIDEEVYKLYGLTDEEIKIIESST